jgi:dihydrofolate reductase
MAIKTTIPPLSIIVAVDESGGFGKDGKIPWNIPEDMKHFQEVTKGGVCIMGRKTYEDMLAMTMARKEKKATKETGSPPTAAELQRTITDILPGRESFVVTRNTDYIAQGATAVTNIREAIQRLDETDHREIFIIGGEKIFIEALSWTRTIYLTIIKGDTYQCDKYFPIEVLNKHYKIANGKETEKLYLMTYKRG